MKVKELIAKLQQMNEEDNIEVFHQKYIGYDDNTFEGFNLVMFPDDTVVIVPESLVWLCTKDPQNGGFGQYAGIVIDEVTHDSHD